MNFFVYLNRRVSVMLTPAKLTHQIGNQSARQMLNVPAGNDLFDFNSFVQNKVVVIALTLLSASAVALALVSA